MAIGRLGTGFGRLGAVGTAAAAASLSPALTNLWSWVKADVGTFQDSSLTTPASADAAPIGGWQDQSGNSRHWTQTVVGSKPALKLAIVNGKPVIRFAVGSPNDFLNGSDASALTEGEIFIVVAANNDPDLTTINCGLWYFSTGTGGSDDSLYPFSDSNIYDKFGSSARKTVGNPTPLLTSFRLYNVISASGEWTANLDGTQIFTTATNTVQFGAAPTLGQAADAVLGFGGDIAEVLLYSAKLSAGDRTTTKAYIASKYGLTIA